MLADDSPTLSRFHHLAGLYFLLITVIAQLTGAVLFAALHSYITSLPVPAHTYGWQYLCATGWCVPLGLVLLPLWGICAWLISYLLKLSRWWQILNLVVGPLSVLYLSMGLPAWLLLVPIALGTLTYLPAFWTRVPYYPTSEPMYRAIAAELPQDKAFTFIDLGCGFSGLINYLSQRFPQSHFSGVEIGLLPFLVSRLRFMRRKNVRILFKSFWNMPLTPYDVVYTFLAPGPMPKLWEKACQEMEPNSVLLVNSFQVPAKAERMIEVDDERKCCLYRYRIKG